jgi:hypothetical protein
MRHIGLSKLVREMDERARTLYPPVLVPPAKSKNSRGRGSESWSSLFIISRTLFSFSTTHPSKATYLSGDQGPSHDNG